MPRPNRRHAARFSSQWEGVRLFAPSAVRLRASKLKSEADSPTLQSLLGVAKLSLRGLLLESEQRRFAALARELSRRGFTPPSDAVSPC